jgi:hypothetical protein
MISFKKIYTGEHDGVLLENIKQFKTKMLSHGYGEDEVTSAIKTFIDLKDKHRVPDEYKDIMKWYRKPFEQFEVFVNELKSKKSKREVKRMRNNPQLDEMRKADNIEIMYDESGIIAFAPKDFAASQYWAGSRTDWCVAAGEHHWDDYVDTAMFIYVFDFNREDYNMHTDSGDVLSKIAFRFTPDGEVYEAYDAADSRIEYKQVELEYQDDYNFEYDVIYSAMADFAEENHDRFMEKKVETRLKAAKELVTDAEARLNYISVEDIEPIAGDNEDGQPSGAWIQWNFDFSLQLVDVSGFADELNTYILAQLEDELELSDIENVSVDLTDGSEIYISGELEPYELYKTTIENSVQEFINSYMPNANKSAMKVHKNISAFIDSKRQHNEMAHINIDDKMIWEALNYK